MFKIVNEYVTIRVAAVLETLVGGFICGIKLFERSLSKKWLIPRVFVYFFVHLQKKTKGGRKIYRKNKKKIPSSFNLVTERCFNKKTQ